MPGMGTTYVLLTVVAAITLLSLYLWRLHVVLSSVPDEARKLRKGGWTRAQIRAAYEKTRKLPTDVKQYLFVRQDRRYIVLGGSGMVGGWIVRHLLMRGESPSAIRVLDQRPIDSPDIRETKVEFIQTDLTDRSALREAFQSPWQDTNVSRLPITVFHTAAYINASERTADALPKYMRVNVEGTKNVIDACKVVGADILIATSSASIATLPKNYFIAPWQQMPKHYVQVAYNGDPVAPNGRLEDFAACYAYSKNEAEKLVRAADGPQLHTGCIRPGHAIYGHLSPGIWNVFWNSLNRGGNPTWIRHCTAQYVSAENVSIAHLAYENRLISQRRDTSLVNMGGRGYGVTDPGPAVVMDDYYNAMETLAHPTTPVVFPLVSPVAMVCMAHLIEAYLLARARYMPILPDLPADLKNLTPSTMNLSLGHLCYDDSAIRDDLGFRHAVDTLEGLCKTMIDWNDTVDRRLAVKKEKGEVVEVRNAPESLVPAP